MIVGKMLKEKYGFDNEEVVKMFCEQYGYSKKFVEDLLNDKWTDLLICHEMDILDFTKIDEPLFRSWTDNYSFSNTCAPMGKPYDNPMCELAKAEIDLSPFEPKLFVRHTEFGSTVRAGFFPNPGEVEFKPEEGDLTPSALNMLNAIGVTPVQFCQGDDNGDPKFLGQVLDQLQSDKVVHDSDIPVPRSKRTHELDEEDVNRIYPHRTVNLLEGIDVEFTPPFCQIPVEQWAEILGPEWFNDGKLTDIAKKTLMDIDLTKAYPSPITPFDPPIDSNSALNEIIGIVGMPRTKEILKLYKDKKYPILPTESDLLAVDWEKISERPEVIPNPGPDNIVVPVVLLEALMDIAYDADQGIIAGQGSELLVKHKEKYSE